jgi:ArsR family transcriptional regulator
MESFLSALRAAAEPTRMRLLALLADGELTVGELVTILGQSQPRVSRHLRLLVEAGLLEKAREGSRMFHRLKSKGEGFEIARRLLALLPADDETIALDRARLAWVKGAREKAAAEYFSRNAPAWNKLRSLHIDEGEVEKALSEMLPATAGDCLLDIGTGTGRLLELFGPKVLSGQGVDLSSEMLAIARSALNQAGLANCAVRQADLYRVPFDDRSFSLITIHQVLHYLDRPERAIIEAARVLRPGGKILITDFAPHDLDELRAEHKHRRLGFADDEVSGWLEESGLSLLEIRHLPGVPLTVTLWLAELTASLATGQASDRANVLDVRVSKNNMQLMRNNNDPNFSS